MSEALAKVKRELGREAIILHTRTFRRGGLMGFGGRTVVEITATRNLNILHPAASRGMLASASGKGRGEQAEEPALRVAAVGVPQPSGKQPDSGLRGELAQIRAMVESVLEESRRARAPSLPDDLVEYYLGLIQVQVAEDLARDLVERLRQRWGNGLPVERESVRKELCQYIASMVPEAGPTLPSRGERPRTVAMVGPTGVGKTTTIAKLAAHFKLRENLRVGLITIDTYRIAAVDQLRVYADIIGVPLTVVMTPAELADALERFGGYDVVLIDTAGRGQNDGARLEELSRFLATARPDETHLVLASNCSEAFLLQAVERFSRVGADRVVFTKLDEAVGFGVLLNVLRRIDKRLSYLTTGQDVPDDIEVGQAHRVAELILDPGRFRQEVGPAASRGSGLS